MPRIADVYAALPAITGKLELEYEGELKGGDTVARELIRTAVGKVFTTHTSSGVNVQPIVQWFELGGELKLPETASAAEELAALRRHSGTDGESRRRWASSPSDAAAVRQPPAEFILEGLYAHRRISRSEERGFDAERPKPAEQREPPGRPPRRPYN